MPQDDLPTIPFESSTAWETWLESHHADAPGLWLKMAKKGSGMVTVTIVDAIEVALCFGWIDGQRRSFDDVWFLQRFTPRRPRSRWSQINRDRAEMLIVQGRMRPAGREEVERAKADGRWEAAYPSPKNMQVPADLAHALTSVPDGAKAFAGLAASERWEILIRLHHTTDPTTRIRRIADVLAKLTGHPNGWE
jgi:uncharacterized protein YdeI (YjbR/CyaY-like superfamily)